MANLVADSPYQVAEFDSPKVLLENPDSMFASLAKEAGVGLNTAET